MAEDDRIHQESRKSYQDAGTTTAVDSDAAARQGQQLSTGVADQQKFNDVSGLSVLGTLSTPEAINGETAAVKLYIGDQVSKPASNNLRNSEESSTGRILHLQLQPNSSPKSPGQPRTPFAVPDSPSRRPPTRTPSGSVCSDVEGLRPLRTVQRDVSNLKRTGSFEGQLLEALSNTGTTCSTENSPRRMHKSQSLGTEDGLASMQYKYFEESDTGAGHSRTFGSSFRVRSTSFNSSCPPESYRSRRSSTDPGGHTSAASLHQLHKAVEQLMISDPKLYSKLQAGMKGIGSLAKETGHLEVRRDTSTGATCINQYVVVKTLGRGSFGKVKLCMNTVNSQLCAIKMINRSYLLRTLQRPKPGLRRRTPRPSTDVRMSMEVGRPDNTSPPTSAWVNQLQTRTLTVPSQRRSFQFDRSGSPPMETPIASSASRHTTPVRTASDSERSSHPLDEISREIAIMKKLDHPNVVKLYEVIDTPDSQHLMLVMEYMEKGPVLQTDRQSGFDRFPEELAAEYLRQACRGLDYLHYNNVVHGDLKPENLLVSASGQLKISDFGSSSVVDGRQIQQRMAGTPAFRAPELVENSSIDPVAADIWALGVCLYCFIFGCLPFQGQSPLEVLNAISTSEVGYPQEHPVSDSLKDLFNRFFQKDPKLRITMPELMDHPWVTDNGVHQLVSCRTLPSPPRALEVTREERQGAIDRSSNISLIRARLKERTYRPGEYLFRQGTSAHCVFFVMSGCVELIREYREGEVGESLEHSFTVDLDESLTLEAMDMGLPADLQIINGRVHIDRMKAKDLRQQRQSWYREQGADDLIDIRGPGSIVGEVVVGEDVRLCPYSGRAKEEVTVLKLSQDSYITALVKEAEAGMAKMTGPQAEEEKGKGVLGDANSRLATDISKKLEIGSLNYDPGL